MKTVAIVQARMGSTRLPGKVLRPLGQRSVLGHVIHRARACPLLDGVVVAIPSGARDEVLAEEALRHGAAVHRGSESDVLERYHDAAESAGADWIVRLTADCPLIDPAVICELVERFGAARRAGDPVDYMSNTLVRTYPRGLDVEVFTMEALRRAHLESTLPEEREHVTPYLYGNPDQFGLAQHRRSVDLSNHRWTLDTPEDWALIEAIFSALGRDSSDFSTDDVLRLLELRPELAELNRAVQQKTLSG